AQPVFEAPDPANVELADTPLTLEAIGLRLFPQAGSSSFTQTVAGMVTSTIRLNGGAGTVSIQRRTTTRTDLSLLEIEETLLKKTLGLPDATSGVSIDDAIETGVGRSLGRSPTIASAGRIARPFYILLNESSDEPYRGFAVLKLTSVDFVLFQLSADDVHFERAREVYEVMLGSAELLTHDVLNERRGTEISAGVALLGGLSAAAYEAVIRDCPEQFERIYRPAPGGAEADEKEIGYRRVKAWIGPREDLMAAEPTRPGADDGGDGFLLRIDGLVLLDDGRRADSKSVYYLSRDRRQEAWSVTMAIRARSGKPDVWTELGARSGDSMSVQINQAGQSAHTIRPAIEGEGYISRLESYLIPQLLIRAGKPGEYAFYSYDQAAESNRLRRIELARVPDRPGLWRVTTRRVDEQFETADFNEYGRLIRSETSDGLIKRPIEFDRLYRIWESKGLPLD
ncbi:MAG: hypothetical protein K8E66_07470, partial [Phycisphaerales bacterium]|nr:hypothetical protein [Phycisphaerales bacterium]